LSIFSVMTLSAPIQPVSDAMVHATTLERGHAEDVRQHRTLDGGPLEELRDRAERQLNAVRAVVLALLAIAAFAYAPSLTPALRVVNVSILVPTLAWTLGQYLQWYDRPRLPAWLTLANPVVDITAVTASMAGYGLTQSATLALRSPMFLAYFVILAARPVTSSTRRAAAAAALTVAEYIVLVGFLVVQRGVSFKASPLSAAAGTGIAPLDEGAKLLLLAVAGAVATYATAWHERLAVAYSRAARERERLEIRLAQAQLESLKNQLQPHFLFNALNAITALIPTDARAAQRTVHGLSELLRLSLNSSAENEVRLDRELELLGHYLAIQRLRFQERLTVQLDVDPEVGRAFIPNLLLQPLVENAIRHGIGPRAAGGSIAIRAGRHDDVLRLRVADDGIGARLSGEQRLAREGVGLSNTRARLQHLYGDRHRLAFATAPGEGFAVEIDVPYRI
jgi:two-component sensor histidine kinase